MPSLFLLPRRVRKRNEVNELNPESKSRELIFGARSVSNRSDTLINPGQNRTLKATSGQFALPQKCCMMTETSLRKRKNRENGARHFPFGQPASRLPWIGVAGEIRAITRRMP
jgi:hypothetical protein